MSGACKVLVAAAGLALSVSGAAGQQTFFNYTGPDFGNWNAAGNWTPFGVPSVAGHVPLIPGGKTVRFGTGAPQQITIDKMQIDHGGQVEMLNDYDLTIRTQTDGTGTLGLLSLAGIMYLSSAGNATDLRLSGPNGSYLVIGGMPGCPNLITMSNNIQNRIYGANGVERLDLQAGSTIDGAGQIGLNSMQIRNMGVIAAKGSAGLTIDPNGSGLANLGGSLIANTGNLELAGGSYDNQGTIRSVSGSVILSGCDITGGVFESTGAGVIQGNTTGASTIIRSVTNNGVIRLPNDIDLYVLGGLVNNGTFQMNSAGNATDVYVGDNLTISGSGVWQLTNNAQNRIYDVTGAYQGRVLTNVNNTIQGAGQIGLNTIDIVNQPGGTIRGTNPAGIAIDPAVSFLNQGTLRAETGSFLNFLTGGYTFTTPAVAGNGGTVFFNGGTYTGTIATEGTGVCRVDTSGTSTQFTDLTLNGRLLFPNDQDAVFYGTLTNQGLVDMQSAGNATDLFLGASLMLTGGGTVQLSNNAQNRLYDVTNAYQGRTLTNVNNTIQGAGQIGLNTIDIVNQPGGTIRGTNPAGIAIDPAVSFLNQGTLRAESASFLNFGGGAYTFSAPAVAGTGGTVYFSAGTYTGTIASEGTGVCRVNTTGTAVQFTDLTLNGRLLFSNDQDAVMSGTLTNQGLVDMQSAGNATDIYLGASLTLTGGGTVQFTNNVQNRIYDVTGAYQGRVLTNANNTIQGAGQIGLNTIDIVNGPAGTMNASSSGGLGIDAAVSFDNQGTLIASGGPITIQPATFTTSGTVIAEAGRKIDHAAPGNSWFQTGGLVIADGEIEIDSDSYQLQGGVLSGSGIVDSNVNNTGGIVAPGSSPGLLTIQGTYTQGAAGQMYIEISGTGAGTQYDRLTSTLAASLGGTLQVNFVSYVPTIGETFDILTASSRTGTFANVSLPTNRGLQVMSITYMADRVRLTVIADCGVDYNTDGSLNPDDLGDFITDYFTVPPVPGPGGYAAACPDNDPPYDQGFKAAYTGDGSPQCNPPFPDNLGDYITAYFAGC